MGLREAQANYTLGKAGMQYWHNPGASPAHNARSPYRL